MVLALWKMADYIRKTLPEEIPRIPVEFMHPIRNSWKICGI
jgi:hypothetical protein